MTRFTGLKLRQFRERTAEIRRAIAAMDLLVPGSILTRTKVCGRPNCRCASDANARHGPYHEWSRSEDRRLVHSVVSPDQAELLVTAIANYREVERLISLWIHESTVEILAMKRT